MVSNFLQMQMDYFFFFYGLGFILLAAAAAALSRAEKQRMPWKWLCLFGLTHGINEWLDLFAFSLKDGPAFSIVRLIIMVLSFLFLIEFGRAGSRAVHGKGPGRWVFIPLLLLAGLGAFAGMSGLNAAARYTLGLTGGLWSAAALWRHRHAAHPVASRSLLIAAISMGIYGLATGVVVPQARFFPATFFNQAAFLAFTGFPIQLLRGVLACSAAASVWQYYGAWRKTAFKDVISPAALRPESWTMVAMVTVLVAGWIMTCSFGGFGQRRDVEQYESDLKLAQKIFESSVETADRLVQTMANSPNLTTMGSKGRSDLAAINATIDRYGGVIPDSICYVLDATGITLASSNRDTPSSFVGRSYAVRPYFKQAMEGLQGRYVAVGLTSKVPGYYSSFPVRDSSGRIACVVVVKLDIDKLFSVPMHKNYGFLADPNGVILSSTHPGFLLSTLRPIGEEARRRLTQSAQFPAIPESSVLPAHAVPGTLFTFRGEILRGFEQTTCVEGLSFVILGSMNSEKMLRLVSILITLLTTVLLVVFFVTQQRNSESSTHIAASERLYRTLVEGSPNWIGLFDTDGCCVTINRNGLTALGRTETEVHGKRFVEIWPEKTRPMIEDAANRVLRGERVSFEADQFRPDGSPITWNVILNPDCGEDGTVRSFVSIANDISARKRAEEKLLQLNEILEQRVAKEVAKNTRQELLLIQQSRLAAMGEMIGNIAHQWRQPLNALGILLFNIKDAYQFNTLDADFLDQAVEDGNRLVQKMSTTISDFSNFFRPNKEINAFSALGQIGEAIALVASSFQNYNISIHVDALQDLELLGFPNEYSQVLLNLLSNAKEAILACNPPVAGRVDIVLTEEDSQGCVSVRDNGGGIADDIVDRIFEPYFSTKKNGSGIGLYMSKMIIERNMNGSITARNIEGGAEFIVASPLAKDGPYEPYR